MDGNNDNDFSTFMILAAPTARVTRRLVDEKHDEDRERQTARDRAEKENAERHREYVNQRLRELTAFERRVGGKKI